MLKKSILFVAILTLVISCNQVSKEADNEKNDEILKEESLNIHESFFQNLSKLCGKSFKGKEIYRSHHGESMAEFEMIMHVNVCKDDQIHIPFHIGEDKSRTWQFFLENGSLSLRHDHRHDDGTPEEQTMYGGYADDTGCEYRQNFPADEYSAELIEDGGGNVWTIKLDEDMTTFTYRLERDKEKRWRVDFDLTKPL